jgi:hypothetical protein
MKTNLITAMEADVKTLETATFDVAATFQAHCWLKP